MAQSGSAGEVISMAAVASPAVAPPGVAFPLSSLPPPPPHPSTVRGAPGAAGGTGGRLATLRAWFALRRLRKGSGGGKAAKGPPGAAALDPLRRASGPGQAKGCRGSFSSTSSTSSSSSASSASAASAAATVAASLGPLPGPGPCAQPVECLLCLCELSASPAPSSTASSPLSSPCTLRNAWPPSLLTPCRHLVCTDCWQSYLRVQINESQVPIACPACALHLHPDDIIRLLASLPDKEEAAALLAKYEFYMVRRVLASVPDARWCPAPDCNFAIIAEHCDRCPRLKCLRPGCGTVFCYRCKQAWHPGKTCKTARAARIAEVLSAIDPIEGEVKKCPECGMYVLKMNDGTCNHMVCNVCGCEFCWLCMSKVGDMHFLSPSGCTFWGRKPWSRRKRLFLQIATLVGAPVGIAILAGLAVPALTFGIPVWAGRRAVRNLEEPDIHKLRLNAVLAVFFSFMLSPFIAAVVVGVGVPVLFAYVYTVVPVALCRSLESACTCSDVRERLFDCLEGSLDDIRRRSSLDDGAEVGGNGAGGSSEPVSGMWGRVRRWLHRLRGEDAAKTSSSERRRRRRRTSGRSSRRKRRDEEAAGDRKYGDDSTKSTSSGASPPDMLHLESLMLHSSSARVESDPMGAPGDSPHGSQQLRVLVHAEMPPTRGAQPSAEEAERSPSVCLDAVASSCPSRCATPMTAVEIDAPICPIPIPPAVSASSPPSPTMEASSEHRPSAPPAESEAPTPGPRPTSGPRPVRSQSLEMDHELLMLRHLSLDEERLTHSFHDVGDTQA